MNETGNQQILSDLLKVVDEPVEQMDETAGAAGHMENEEVIDLGNSFDFDGFQVVRREFFAHMFEPAVSFNNCKFYVNSACLAKFPETDYVQVLINQETRIMALRPCEEGVRDSFAWCSVSKGKRKPKQTTCKLFFAKVVFCAIISSLAVIASCLLLIFSSSLETGEGLLCLLIGLMFTFAQVLVATKLDLNYAKVSLSDFEMDKQTTRTLSKVILIGVALAIIASVSVIFFALVSSGLNLFTNEKMLRVCMYLVPVLIGLIYLTCAIYYYRRKLFRSFELLAN